MSLKFIAFDFDEETGWKLHAEGVYPNDIHALMRKIPHVARAFFPSFIADESKREFRKAEPKVEPEPIPAASESPAALAAVTPDGQIYRLAETMNDPTAKSKGYSIFWVDPDTGKLSRCKGKGFTGWPERTLEFAESHFRDWAGDVGYEVREVRV